MVSRTTRSPTHANWLEALSMSPREETSGIRTILKDHVAFNCSKCSVVLFCKGADDELRENSTVFRNRRSSKCPPSGLLIFERFGQKVLWIFCPNRSNIFSLTLQKTPHRLEKKHRARIHEEGVDVETAGEERPGQTILKWLLPERSTKCPEGHTTYSSSNKKGWKSQKCSLWLLLDGGPSWRTWRGRVQL